MVGNWLNNLSSRFQAQSMSASSVHPSDWKINFEVDFLAYVLAKAIITYSPQTRPLQLFFSKEFVLLIIYINKTG